jgi:hypothetical protein
LEALEDAVATNGPANINAVMEAIKACTGLPIVCDKTRQIFYIWIKDSDTFIKFGMATNSVGCLIDQKLHDSAPGWFCAHLVGTGRSFEDQIMEQLAKFRIQDTEELHRAVPPRVHAAGIGGSHYVCTRGSFHTNQYLPAYLTISSQRAKARQRS